MAESAKRFLSFCTDHDPLVYRVTVFHGFRPARHARPKSCADHTFARYSLVQLIAHNLFASGPGAKGLSASFGIALRAPSVDFLGICSAPVPAEIAKGSERVLRLGRNAL